MVLVQLGWMVLGTAPSTLAHHSSFPPLSKAVADLAFCGVIFTMLKGAPCNLGSWQPGVMGSGVHCGGDTGSVCAPMSCAVSTGMMHLGDMMSLEMRVLVGVLV